MPSFQQMIELNLKKIEALSAFFVNFWKKICLTYKNRKKVTPTIEKMDLNIFKCRREKVSFAPHDTTQTLKMLKKTI